MVAVPAAAGVKTPLLEIAPMLDGLTDQVTDELYPPVPVTLGVQVELCAIVMEDGEQVKVTAVIVGDVGVLLAFEPLPPPHPDERTAAKIAIAIIVSPAGDEKF